ncbi:hypothetical protein [Aquimarina muelleri]|uniref:Lipoprotein n=1 Tax=Aquimarina muelleri TaxID=279356 RepID=A0A918N4J2_9FLAO|nr:hypothetical protein [Aquimarina muelleri]MCX2764440.1 hypothetical protein [Aquimarina muelleri]GGX21368.1 hypothetical protein GCM10007384_23240 [Aquimarina muelleri]
MKTSLLFNIIILIVLVSCGVPQADFDKLKQENEKLKNEIAECQLTPSQIFEQANEYYDALEYLKSKDRLISLIDKYPNSKETKKGKGLLKKVEKEIIETSKALEKDQLKENNNEDYKNAISKMKKKYDVDNEVTWYSDKSSNYTNDQNYIQTYIGKKEKRKPWLALSINYFAKNDWLFIQRIEIIVDGKTFEIEEYTPGEFNSKEESEGKREWIDRVIKGLDMPMIKAIASGKTIKIKFVGKDDLDTRTISKQEKKAIKNVLEAFEALEKAE